MAHQNSSQDQEAIPDMRATLVTESDHSSDASSKSSASVYRLFFGLDCSRKILKEILCKFLSHYDLKTIQDCTKKFGEIKTVQEESFKKHEKYIPELQSLDLHQSEKINDPLIFHDILCAFFIENKHSSWKPLSELKSIRNSFSHSDNSSSPDDPFEFFKVILNFIHHVGNDFENIISFECIEKIKNTALKSFHHLTPSSKEPHLLFEDLRKEVQYYESCSILIWAKSAFNCQAVGNEQNISDCNFPLNLSMKQSSLGSIEDVFTVTKCPKTVFLFGEAGSGKSHLSRGLANSWLTQTSENLKMFKLVLFVDICDVKTTIYDYLKYRYPEVFMYVEKLLLSDSNETFIKYWKQWPVLVIIDGFCSAFSRHRELLGEAKQLFTCATLLITASLKDLTALSQIFMHSDRTIPSEIATIVINHLNFDQANAFAQKILHFLNSNCTQNSFSNKENIIRGSKYLRYPLDIILFCILLHFDELDGEPMSCTSTQSELVARLYQVCQQKASAKYLEFSKALGDAALQSIIESNSSYCNVVVEFSPEECLELHFPVHKVRAASSSGKVSYRFLNKCFLQKFAATAIADTYCGKVEELVGKEMVRSRRSLYLRLERMLLPLINCFLKKSNLTPEIVKVLKSSHKYLECDLSFWGSVACEAGLDMPPELRLYIDEHLQNETWTMTEKNYEACFSCFTCMTTLPMDLTIDLHECNERRNVIESIFVLFGKLPGNLFNQSPVEVVLLYHSDDRPLRLRLPSSVKVKKVEGSISMEDISEVLQWPDLTSVSFRISQADILTAFIDSMNTSSEGLQEVTLQLNAGIVDDVPRVSSLRQLETLAIAVDQVSDQNLNRVVNILLKLVPKRNPRTTIDLHSRNLGGQHCRQLINMFSSLDGGLVRVFSNLELYPAEKEDLRRMFHRESVDGLYQIPSWAMMWNRRPL